MRQITKCDLEFFEESKQLFSSDPTYDTYRGSDDEYIALRMGMDSDCIMIYKLEYPIANFAQVLPKRTNKFKKWNELKERLLELVEEHGEDYKLDVNNLLNMMSEMEK